MSCNVMENNKKPTGLVEMTPSRKRKRETENNEIVLEPAVTCFTNAAFSSTPKKLIGRRRKWLADRENTNPFVQNPCLEVKSISAIVKETKQFKFETEPKLVVIPKNPYEVLRKPPKKKKRQTEVVEACFENPALNLELPEKQFNPYEVLRAPAAKAPLQSTCFVNKALNLRGQDVPAARNPFEIARSDNISAAVTNPIGVENFGLDKTQPTKLNLAIPFKPNVGCRIDFKNMELLQLTPSKLLAEKLVFSPVAAPKVSLGSSGEESSMDIGRELDRYQLELENSINEAKMRKNQADDERKVNEQHLQMFEVDQQRIGFNKKLEVLAEIVEEEEKEDNEDDKEESIAELNMNLQNTNYKNDLIANTNSGKTEVENDMLAVVLDNPKSFDNENADDDVTYASDSEENEIDELDFKMPAPFVRAYRRAASPKGRRTASKESLTNSNKITDKSIESNEQNQDEKLNVKNLIRKSIRKLMHPLQVDVAKEKKKPQMQEKDKNLEQQTEKQHATLMNTIRQSLRRKAVGKQRLIEEETADESIIAVTEISIIDTSERTLKLKTNAPQTDYMNIEQLTNEKKHTLRNSIRRSTREMRQQLMKKVFHKSQEDYTFTK